MTTIINNFLIPKELYSKPFQYENHIKDDFFIKNFIAINNHHQKNSPQFKKITEYFKFNYSKNNKIDKYPFIPVSLFKKHKLISVDESKLIREIVSSGTSGELSKIYLDQINSLNQKKVLTGIVSSVIGKERIPMLIIDSDPSIKVNNNINARKAAIYGFSVFGKNITYALDANYSIKYKEVSEFFEKYSKQKFLIFGFTYLVFLKLIKEFKLSKISNPQINKAILIHGGGWKKIENLKISKKNFKSMLLKKFNIPRVYNYYGMVEQTGSIFFECECGYLTTSIFSDIIIRDSFFNVLKPNQKGIMQLLSLIPSSYPGHNILTEDIGEQIPNNKCTCKIKGKKFLIHGRLDKTERRGCSDV